MIRSVTHPLEILFGGGVGLSCAGEGSLHAEELHGLFAGDTRVLSTWRFTVAGHAWHLLARSRPGPSTAQWDLQNPAVRSPTGDLAEGDLHCRLRRRVLGALHDCLVVTSFARRPWRGRLALQLDADFSDVFQVKERSTPPRLDVQRVPQGHAIALVFERAGFRRALHLRFDSEHSPSFVGAQVIFDVVLAPQRPWRCCLSAEPELDGKRLVFQGDPHAPDLPAQHVRGLAIDAAPRLAGPFRQGCRDLDRLAMREDGDPPFIAAGAPWFLALFGRDTLVTSLMAGLLGSWHARGALAALGRTQARRRDDFRDAEPGKIAHELRHGELAHAGAIPHTPYFGSHDAPALYVLALWNAWRFTGDDDLLVRHLAAAEAALRWCEEGGDIDGDGLLEYRTRSSRGYHNQGWKDAGDAIPHDDGVHAGLPIATVELQGYWYAARLAMAELFERAGRPADADHQRAAARALRALVEERYWMDDAGCYALALDGAKRPVRSISSNPGHLLWCGLPSPERARRLAARLLADDMYSGFGVRTLSAHHAAYNPLSYQLGSVWPHDSALLAAGLMRYGLREPAARVLGGLLEAAAMFDQDRLPELFCGFARDDGPPVPYEKANVPQAWAAAVPILAAQLFLGLVPDAPAGRCYLAPWLPAWLPRLELTGVHIGGAELGVSIERGERGARIVRARLAGLRVVEHEPAAALWGRPS